MTATQATLKTAPKITLPAGLTQIVLTGFMGAGKTTSGRLLASALGWDFLDLDVHLEERTSLSVPQVFERHGEPHFRRLESTALANALGRTATVLATGGGVTEELTNRLLLEQTPGLLVVFLEAPFACLFDRCLLQSFASPQHARPLMASSTVAESRYNQRQPLYRRLARLTVSTAEITPAETADAILGYVAGLPASGPIPAGNR